MAEAQILGPRSKLFGRDLPSPVFVASGTGGHGAELSGFIDLRTIGGIVVKSLATFAHEGNPSPRLAPLPHGMANSVGLPGPGISRWRKEYLPELDRLGVAPVVSIWGRSLADFVGAAEQLEVVASSLMGIEINVSCPNTERGGQMFAHSASDTAEVVRAVRDCVSLPIAVKISPNTDRTGEVTGAALDAGATAIVAANTYLGQVLRPYSSRGALGRTDGGGISGPGIFPLSLRIVADLCREFPEAEIVGCGGISSGEDALAYLSVGACAVQVGTANFVDPRASSGVARELAVICGTLGVRDVRELRGRLEENDLRRARKVSRNGVPTGD
ncbi:MAG: dihydroorotate dehydrogenase [Acidimicrobiales bacterium]